MTQPGKARRPAARPWHRLSRRAARPMGLWLGIAMATALPGAASAQQIDSARFTTPTTHYAHAILGDGVEYAGLHVTLTNGRAFRLEFPAQTRVFEDIAPRLWDVTGDGAPEVVVIETDPAQGAQLAIYGLNTAGKLHKLAATPHIGRTHRWLAPIGAADLDGDGRIEIAYVDRPHLAKVLRIWRLEDGVLRQVTEVQGLTNHQIGWDHIPGGIRICAGTPQMITADAGWQNIMVTQWQSGRISTSAIGRYSGPDSLNTALRCP